MDVGNLCSAAELLGLLLVAGAGALSLLPGWSPPSQPGTAAGPQAAAENFLGAGVTVSTHAVAVCLSKIVFAFGGVQGMLDLGEDVPPNVLPFAIRASTALTGALYVAVCWAAIRVVGSAALAAKVVTCI